MNLILTKIDIEKSVGNKDLVSVVNIYSYPVTSVDYQRFEDSEVYEVMVSAAGY